MKTMDDDLLKPIHDLKQRLDALRPLDSDDLASLEAWYDVELTYSSNAIEGNTLTRQETAIVLEKGITVRGKPLKDHQEAVDHQEALRFIRGLADKDRAITQADVREVHRLVTNGTLRDEAGVYSHHRRRVVGSMVVFPAPEKLPPLMEEFGGWLSESMPSAMTALEAHLRLVSIHPFSDGNGRTARLLMNLLLLRAGYPPLVIQPESRPDYLEGIEQAQLGKGEAAYHRFMLDCLRSSLEEYLEQLQPDRNA